MVPGKLQRQCHLGRVMEIQSLGLLGQEKQIRVKYSSKYLPQHILKKMLETPALQARNLTEHPGGRGILAGAGTACLGGQRDRGRNTGRRKGRENLRVCLLCPGRGRIFDLFPGSSHEVSGSHDQKLDRTCLSKLLGYGCTTQERLLKYTSYASL